VDVLARSLADRGTEGLLAAYDRYADQLYAYGCVLLADEEAAASAVQDAFLVAAERVTGLRDTARLVPWLYALTRNECLRRRPSRGAAGQQRELVELAVRHGLAAGDVAAVLGVELVDTAESLDTLPPPEALDPPAVRSAPAGLRDRLAAAVDGSTAAQRIALARRAGPFQGDGFPLPLDRRRLSGRVLAASIVAAVLGTLARLAGVPSVGQGASGAAPAGVGDPAAAPAARPPLSEQSSWPAPSPAPAMSLQPTVQPRPASTAATPDPATVTEPSPTAPTDRTAVAAPVVLGWLDNRTAPNCPRRWTARVHVLVDGVDPNRVQATWFDGDRIQTVLLRHHGSEWIGDLGGIPVGERLWWRAAATTATGDAASTLVQPLAYTCAR